MTQRIVFGHYHSDEGCPFPRHHRMIACSILEQDEESLEWTLLSRGLAICSFLDNPNKAEGHRRALGRAKRILTRSCKKVLREKYGEIRRPEAMAVIGSLELPYMAMKKLQWKEELHPEIILPHEERELEYLNGAINGEGRVPNAWM